MSKIEEAFKLYKEEKLREGYPEGLVDKSIKFAQHYMNTLLSFIDSSRTDLVERAKVEMLPEALEFAERWIKGIAGLAGATAEVKGRAYWEQKIKSIVA
jgi:flagellar biosynthesis/type III secretory pathway protein FliH